MGGLMILISISYNQSFGTAFTLEPDFVSDEVVNWMNQCDIEGDGVYVLKLSREKADELLFANEAEEVPEGHREVPEDTYCVYIYINNFKRNDVKKGLLGRAETKDSTLEVSYNSDHMLDDDSPDYELSEISAIGYKVNDLKIFIDDEKVEYSLSELE